MRTYNIKVPSLLFQYSLKSEYGNNIDLNKKFWQYLFSSKFYDKYIKANNSFVKSCILQARKADKAVINYLKNYKNPKIVQEAHKIFYTVIDFYNKELFSKNSSKLSVTRNLIFSYPNPLIEEIFKDILDEVTFKKDAKYSLKIYFDDEIKSALIIGKYLKQKYNAFVEIDTFTNSDEQVDFGSYEELVQKYSFIDRVITYNNFEKYKNEVKKMPIYQSPFVLINSKNSKTMRFFKKACFWNKCAFCTINKQHTHVKEKEKVDEVIKKHINFLKKNPQIEYLFFTDEAIEHTILVKFCKEILKEGIDVKISVRSRYAKEYKEEDIKILAKAGIRFLGIGLESASNRLNRLMQKRNFDLEPQKINEFIDLFNKHGINLHQYFMIGLPSETKEETDLTYNFIYENLKKRKYFTYSANVFSLNKGSLIYQNPQKYGIKLIKQSFKAQGVPFENIENKGYPTNQLVQMSHQLYTDMFFKKHQTDDVEYGYSFWDFLDRTYIFYQQKMLYDKNPYLFDDAKLIDEKFLKEINLPQNIRLNEKSYSKVIRVEKITNIVNFKNKLDKTLNFYQKNTKILSLELNNLNDIKILNNLRYKNLNIVFNFDKESLSFLEENKSILKNFNLKAVFDKNIKVEDFILYIQKIDFLNIKYELTLEFFKKISKKQIQNLLDKIVLNPSLVKDIEPFFSFIYMIYKSRKQNENFEISNIFKENHEKFLYITDDGFVTLSKRWAKKKKYFYNLLDKDKNSLEFLKTYKSYKENPFVSMDCMMCDRYEVCKGFLKFEDKEYNCDVFKNLLNEIEKNLEVFKTKEKVA